MYKRMTLKLALRYVGLSNEGGQEKVSGFGPMLMDDIEIFNYRKLDIKIITPSKWFKDKYPHRSYFHIHLSPCLYKRTKYKKHIHISRFKNRMYFKANRTFLERRRFIKEYRK